jgi:hypothetical protein
MTKDGMDYSRIGLSAAPDEAGCRIVISEAVLQNAEAKFGLCNVYRFSKMRYYITAVNTAEGSTSDIVITQADMEKDKELCALIESGPDRRIVDYLITKLNFTDKGLESTLTEDAPVHHKGV